MSADSRPLYGATGDRAVPTGRPMPYMVRAFCSLQIASIGTCTFFASLPLIESRGRGAKLTNSKAKEA